MFSLKDTTVTTTEYFLTREIAFCDNMLCFFRAKCSIFAKQKQVYINSFI